jgi:hypothetical protein
MRAWVIGWEKKSESRLDQIFRNDKVRALRMTTALNNVKWNKPAMYRMHGRRVVVIATGEQEGPN